MAPWSGHTGGSSRASSLSLAALLLLALAAAPGANAVCPSPAARILKMHNTYRSNHRVAPLTWSDGLNAQAQAHADACTFGHSAPSSRPGAGESIFWYSAVTYPKEGQLDACSYATYSWYREVAAYNWETHSTRDPSVPVGHLTAMLWNATTLLGCGHTRCASLKNSGWTGPADFVVCQYQDMGNIAGQVAANVLKSSCQASTGDDWCSACNGSTCTACHIRPMFVTRPAIALDAATKTCGSACPAGQPASVNCQLCSANNACVRCKAGFVKSAGGLCAAPPPPTTAAPAAKAPAPKPAPPPAPKAGPPPAKKVVKAPAGKGGPKPAVKKPGKKKGVKAAGKAPPAKKGAKAPAAKRPARRLAAAGSRSRA